MRSDVEIGELKKEFKRSLARSTWRVYAPGGDAEVMWATERSLVRSVLRRLISLGGFIPIVGDILALIPIRYHFDFIAGERNVGSFERRFGLRDRYILDLSGDAERRIDRRVAIALGDRDGRPAGPLNRQSSVSPSNRANTAP